MIEKCEFHAQSQSKHDERNAIDPVFLGSVTAHSPDKVFEHTITIPELRISRMRDDPWIKHEYYIMVKVIFWSLFGYNNFIR